MPRDFRSFAKDNQQQSTSEQDFLGQHKEEASKYEDILNKYKDMSQNDLMRNLFSEASKLKKQGKLDSNTLSNLKSTISPFLNQEQQEMLSSLIKAIDEQK